MNQIEYGRQLGRAEARLEAASEAYQRLIAAAHRGAFVIGTYDAEVRVRAAEAAVDALRNQVPAATVWCVMHAPKGQGDHVESIWSTQDLAESALDVAKAAFPQYMLYVQPWTVDEAPPYQTK